ncbi:hypothetical protein QQ045_026492 [Rhodiola kirilowii]
MQRREASWKGIRWQDGWIENSNYKAILKPKRTEIRGSVLDCSPSQAQMAIQSTQGSLKDTSDHLQHLRKVCFKCATEGNIGDLIDCVQCHIFFVHSQCKLLRENENSDWTCDQCLAKKRMQLIHSPIRIKQTSRMSAGWIPKKKQLSDKRGVEVLQKAGHDSASNSVIKVQAPSLQSTSLPRSGMHVVENRQRRKLIVDYSDIFGDEDLTVDAAAHKSSQGSLPQAQDWHRHIERRNEPNMNQVWQGHVLIQFGSYRADMELFCCLSTKSSSKVAEAVKALPSTISVAVKCRSVVWPRRFQMSTLSDEAIAVYFFPKYEKDDKVYEEILNYQMKHELALLYKMPSKNQNLLIFPSCLLPAESRRLGKEYYMWGAFEEKKKMNDIGL